VQASLFGERLDGIVRSLLARALPVALFEKRPAQNWTCRGAYRFARSLSESVKTIVLFTHVTMRDHILLASNRGWGPTGGVAPCRVAFPVKRGSLLL